MRDLADPNEKEVPMTDSDAPDDRSEDPTGDSADDQAPSDHAYSRRAVASLGATGRPPVKRWTPGVAGTAPDGTRFVVYGRHMRMGGERAWRTNNPGNIKTGAFARANGAIGRDGRYAIFPDELTGKHALQTLLRTPGYVDLLVRDALLAHCSHLDGSTESRARARQYGLDPNRPLGTLDEDEHARLDMAITSTASARQPRVHRVGPSPKPAWAHHVLTQAQSGTVASPPANPVMFDPTNWQVGVWYVRQPDGTFAVSPDQNPRPGADGEYTRYNGDNRWDLMGRQAPGSGDAGAPNPADGPDAGCAPLPGGPPSVPYDVTTTRDDGTVYTIQVLPPGSPLNVPTNATVVANTDGTFLVMYNNDGSPWEASSSGEGEGGREGEGGSGGGSDGGEGGDGGSGEGGGGDGGGGAEPDEGGTSPAR